MIDLSDVTIAFPLRVDSRSREENIDAVIDYFHRNTDVRVLVLEADSSSCYKLKKDYPDTKVCFIEDHDPVFHRTHYLNELLKMVETPVVGFWDADVIVQAEQVEDAVRQLRAGKAVLALPFDGCCYNVVNRQRTAFRETLEITVLESCVDPSNLVYAHLCVGGAVLVARKEYLEAGGENEYFYGWGPEDAERVKRMEILEKAIYRSEGPLFHLAHERGRNSGYATQELALRNRKELFKVCGMHRDELEDYIRTWRWKI